jgi:GTP-binding protein
MFSHVDLYRTVFKKNELLKDGLPQIAFAGRSNVGKSSLLNYLFDRKIAKTSTTPGKTRSVNYYKIDDSFFCVDLPGYGYAKASKSELEKWRIVMEEYFSQNEALKQVFILLDSRHLVLENDNQMIEWVKYHGYPFSFILTKTDKLATMRILEQERELSRQYESKTAVLPVSVLKKTGKGALIAYIEGIIR